MDEILGEIAAAGYDGVPPRVRDGDTADDVLARFARHILVERGKHQKS